MSLWFSALFVNRVFSQVLVVAEETRKQRPQGGFSHRVLLGLLREKCLGVPSGDHLAWLRMRGWSSPLCSLQRWMELTSLLPGAVDSSHCLVLDWFKLGAPSLQCGSLGLVAPMLLLRPQLRDCALPWG